VRTAPDVLLDARITRRMSIGMIAYANELAARLPRVAPDLRFETYRRGGNFGLDEQVRLPRYAARAGARLVHHTSVYAPLATPRPFAITIHDLIHLRYPQYFKRSVGPYYSTIVRLVCARAARVITDDPRTIDDLERFLAVDRRKVRVIPLGVDDAFLRDAHEESADRPYFLYAGNHRPHKDLPTLLAAWLALPGDLDVDLIFTGSEDRPEFAQARRQNGTLRFVGDVGADRLAGLYRGAVAYVHPSLCEGFGLPMLEAAAQGTRILACDEALPGVLRSLAKTFAGGDVAALTALLQAAMKEPWGEADRERLQSLARSYTWDRTAAATAEVYRQILEECPSR
jgi:glycosyltransferase involved in cell wall biosynthesis